MTGQIGPLDQMMENNACKEDSGKISERTKFLENWIYFSSNCEEWISGVDPSSTSQDLIRGVDPWRWVGEGNM